MHLLIPYVPMVDHEDPNFTEFTYGDVRQRGAALRTRLHKGDYVFFHTSLHGKKYITAYYVIDRVLTTSDACKDRAITDKYKNPHLIECLEGERQSKDDAVAFGDPITSRILEHPLLFDKKLARKLSLDIPFPDKRTETQAIGSATRSWRTLTEQDKHTLLDEISKPRPSTPCTLRSIEEVAEVIERDIEEHVARNPALIGPNLTLKGRQMNTAGRLDLIFEDQKGDLTVVELKLNRIGRDALQQVKRYTRHLEKQTNKQVQGVIVCAGLMPAYEEELRAQSEVRILVHGWDLQVRPC